MPLPVSLLTHTHTHTHTYRLHSYDRAVTAYTREAQRNNPEVLLCELNQPRYRQQKALLQFVTRELNILTFNYFCSDDDEDCTVDLTDTCEYYQLPRVEEESFEPTSVSSGDIDQQVDACGGSTPTTPSTTTTAPTTDGTTTTAPSTDSTTAIVLTTDGTTIAGPTGPTTSDEVGGSGSKANEAGWIATTVMVSLALAVMVLNSVL